MIIILLLVVVVLLFVSMVRAGLAVRRRGRERWLEGQGHLHDQGPG